MKKLFPYLLIVAIISISAYKNFDYPVFFGNNVYVEDTLFSNQIDSSLVQRILQIEIANKAYANAYLPSDSTPTTTCADADTWYFVVGNFINQTSNRFGLINDTLAYVSLDSIGAKVMYTTSVSCSKDGARITFGFSSNGEPYPMTTKSADLNIGDRASLTHFFTKKYYTDEKVKWMVKSSVANNNVTITDANLSIEEKRKLY